MSNLTTSKTTTANMTKPASSSTLTVINAGLYKTGTASMAEAYKILGLRPHHGLDLMDLPDHWAILEQAAEGTWPDAPGCRPDQPPLTRADWDSMLCDYDAVTDVASLFAEQLSIAYPEAKVVVVERDVDRWEESFDTQVLQAIWCPLGTFLEYVVTPILNFRAIPAMKKMLYGHFKATTVAEIRGNARKGYKEYYARIRAVVPPERRLEYKLGSGWEPLCEFLGREVPDVPFPRLNERAEHSRKQSEQANMFIKRGALAVAPWFGAVAAVGSGLWFARSRSGVL